MTARPFAVLALAATVAVASCSTLAPPKSERPRPIEQRREATILDGVRVDLHVSSPVDPRVPLVIFASGDGGWFGAAIGMFETMSAAGYPVAGISSRALLRGLRKPGHPLAASRLRDAYGEIINAARRATNSPDAGNVILAGWSRGASISVIVGAEQPKVKLAGIVAIGLPADEDLNLDLESDEDGEPASNVAGGIDTYALSRAISSRIALIQSSGDGYLQADRARTLFGSDSAGRRFYEVSASNHRFSGGALAFRRTLNDALTWISTTEGFLQ